MQFWNRRLPHPHPPPNSMICSQCQMLRELFNRFVASGDMTPRRLEEMLLLGDDPVERKWYSFLCSGTELHAPIAFTVVDPAVVKVDFDHAPPCRWHWAVDMSSDLIDHFRAGMGKAGKTDGKTTEDGGNKEQRRKAKVPSPPAHYTVDITITLLILPKITQRHQRNMPGICWAYAWHEAYTQHMPSICQAYACVGAAAAVQGGTPQRPVPALPPGDLEGEEGSPLVSLARCWMLPAWHRRLVQHSSRWQSSSYSMAAASSPAGSGMVGPLRGGACHPLCPHREAMVCWVRWADSLWKDTYTGGQHVSFWA